MESFGKQIIKNPSIGEFPLKPDFKRSQGLINKHSQSTDTNGINTRC